MRRLGADTLRVGVKWNEVAPAPGSRAAAVASTPPTRRTIPASGPTTTSCGAPSDMGFRVLLDLAPDAPRWATADGAPLSAATVNREPDPREFARFAAAVGERYSGDFEGLPAGRVVLALERAQPPASS